MNNAGKYRTRIEICLPVTTEDDAGFQTVALAPVLATWAEVRTMSGMQALKNGVEFTKTTVRFLIRYPKKVISSQMQVRMGSRIFEIVYLNNVNEMNAELELQCREVKRG